jgi:hypothetical protein
MRNPTALIKRVLRPQIFHSLAVVALLAACNAAPGATIAPTAPPSGQPPTGAPTGSPTDAPTAAPSPTAEPTPSFGEGEISHPTGANDIVLRMASGGGHMMFGVDLIAVPQFTLYGDGRVIFQQVDTRGAPFGALPNLPLVVGQLDEQAVQALLLYALDTGRLAGAKANYDHPGIADAGTTIFNLNANGEEKVVSVYALFEGVDPTAPDPVDRAGMAQLQTLLTNFETEAAESLTDVGVYEPELYRVTLLEGFGEPTSEPMEWPWDDLTMDDFATGDEPGAIGLLTAEQVSQIMEVPNGGQFGIWLEDPDGTVLQAAVRPLLPDEQAALEAL